MKAGGFDCVIGNPPWGSLITQQEKEYLGAKYVNRRGEAESHLFFIEQALNLARNRGLVGFITPNTWLSVLNSQELRHYLLRRATFAEIAELSKYIFAEAPDIVPILVFLENRPCQCGSCLVRRSTVIKIDASNFATAMRSCRIDQQRWNGAVASTINLALTDTVLDILRKAARGSVNLGTVAEVVYGIKTGDNETFVSHQHSAVHTKKALKTGELARFSLRWAGLYLNWSPSLAGYRVRDVEVPKIVVQYIRKVSLPRRIIAALDEGGEFYPLNNYSYILARDGGYSLAYTLAAR